MSEKEWEQFFDLLEKVAKEPETSGQTWQTVRDEIVRRATDHGSDMALVEVAGWFD